MKVGRNDPCPCNSGKKYKHCCWLKEKTLSAQPINKPEVVDYHQSFDGEKWHKRPGRLVGRIVMKKLDDVDQRIESLFSSAISLADKHRVDGLVKRLNDCKHKLYAVRFHLQAIDREIEERIADFQRQYAAGSGMASEIANPVLIYETEAFLFQVKSNLDLMIRTLGLVIPSLKSCHTFSHAGSPGTPDYAAGGKIIKQLKQSNEAELAHLFDSHRAEWIQEMTILRDTITHYSGLKGFNCFIEEPYLGGDKVDIRYPTMPSGERVDEYCQKIFDQLCDLYRSVFKSLEQRIGQA